jgi:hypothetical protein
MSLPTTIDTSVPTGSTSPGLGDNEIVALKNALLDLFGLGSSPTTITAALFSTTAGGLLTVVGTPFTVKRLVGTQGTITADAPVIDLTTTWNAGSTTFTGIKIDVTDTASAAASKLLELFVGGVSKIVLKKDGTVTGPAGVSLTGYNIAVPVKVWIPAAGVNGTSASSIYDLPESNGPTATAYGTSPNKFGALDFADGASALTSQFNLILPSDWTATGGIDLKFIFFSATADATKNIVLTCATKSIADTEDVIAPTFNTAQTVTAANLATANQRNSASITGVTTTGFAAGELATFRVGRDPTDASDTLVATVMLIGCEVTYRRAIAI